MQYDSLEMRRKEAIKVIKQLGYRHSIAEKAIADIRIAQTKESITRILVNARFEQIKRDEHREEILAILRTKYGKDLPGRCSITEAKYAGKNHQKKSDRKKSGK